MLRFFTGLGLGSALPNAIGLASEYAPQKRRASIVMFVASGISLGAIAAGMAAAQLMSTLGWRALFVVGGALPLLLAVALIRWLPESIRFAALIPQGQAEAKRLLRTIKRDLAPDADVRIQSTDAEGGKATVADLFKEHRGRMTVLLWIAFFMSLLNVYLAINWLPTSLNASGFTVEQAAVITSMYHVGGVIGTYTLGVLMDRLGPHAMLMFAFVLAVVGFYTFATVTGHGAGEYHGAAHGDGLRRHRRAGRHHHARVDELSSGHSLDRSRLGARRGTRGLHRRTDDRRADDRDGRGPEKRVPRLHRACAGRCGVRCAFAMARRSAAGSRCSAV